VSGIAWQQDGAARIAMVNGQTVTEGGTVAGARIMAIHRDRVQFSRNGEQFEILLEK
jgi:hypothetical protein